MMVGLRPLLWPGVLALVASPGLAVLALAALLEAAPLGETGRLLDRYALHVLSFTVLQATLSTVLSLVFAVPLARALARRPVFPGRGIVIRLFGIPLVLPAIVAVFGVVAVWGQNGAVNATLGTVGMERFGPIYGLEGILIAHTFFNIPLAVRLLLPVWESIPGETWRLAAQLGMSSWPIFRLIEWPRIAEVLPGIAMLAFLLTFSSFTVVLALGGGPGAATLEVAIYQALRLDFDIVRAVFLAVLQVVICGTVAIVLFRFARFSLSEAGAGRVARRPDSHGRLGRIGDALMIAAGIFWVGAPLAAVAISGLAGPLVDVLARQDVWLAALRSVVVGLGAGFVAVTVGLLLGATTCDLAMRRHRRRLADVLEIAGSQTLIVSPVVLGAGLFVLLLGHVRVFDWALPLAALVNGLVCVPYVLRLVSPVLRRTAAHHDRLCASLGLAGIRRIVWLEGPLALRPLATTLALATALAAGDLTAIALFGTEREATLALLLYRALGSYRMDEAAVIALFLVLVCLAIFVAIEGLGRVAART